MRDGVGPGVRLMVDANAGLDLLQAVELAHAIESLAVAWFEEPVHGNDAGLLAELRRRASIPIAAASLRDRFRLRELMLASAERRSENARTGTPEPSMRALAA